MIEIRAPGAADLPGLSALYRSAFGYEPPEGFWRWKYGDAPGESRQRIALSEGIVVAHAGALGLPARWARGEGLAWQLVDFMGSTAGGGLRSAMVAAGRDLLAELPRVEDVPFLFGFPSARHFRLGARAFGYRAWREVRAFHGCLPDVVTADASAPVEVEIAERSGAWAPAIWERCRVRGVLRSQAFLDWRYYARPDRYYRFYRLRRQGAEGFAVFGYAGDEARAAELWLPDGEGGAEMLRAVTTDLRSLGMTRWTFWPPDARHAQIVESLGARVVEETIFAGCRGRPDEAHPEALAGDFALAMGDYDLV